jgi:lipopolysaccharide export LptBFGC system permease protein LptF
MKKPISFFIVVLLFLFCATALSAAEWEVRYWVSDKRNDGTWSGRSKVYNDEYTNIVSGLTITSAEDAKNEVRKMFGAKKGQDTYENETGTHRFQWIDVGKTLKEDKKQKAPKEPKQDWVDKNLPALKL